MKQDPHANEPSVEIDPELHRQYIEALQNAEAWKKEADRLQRILDEQIGKNYAATINGRKVLTHRPINQWQVRSLVADYPDLTSVYMKQEVVEKFDLVTFRANHPDIAEQYHSRSFRRVDTSEE